MGQCLRVSFDILWEPRIQLGTPGYSSGLGGYSIADIWTVKRTDRGDHEFLGAFKKKKYGDNSHVLGRTTD